VAKNLETKKNKNKQIGLSIFYSVIAIVK